MRTRRMVSYILGGVGVLVLLGALIFGVTRIIGIVQDQRLARELANQPTQPPATNTPRPTETVTPIPTRTPLPESLALTLEPTVIPGQAPRGNIEFRLTPTSPYILTPHGASILTNAYEPFYEGDYSQAIDLVRQAREEGDNDIDGYYIEGVSLYRQGNVQEAEDVILDGLDINPGFAPLNLAIGRIYEEEGATAQARSAFEQAISSDPTYLDPYLELAELEARQGNTEEAFGLIEQARALGRYNYNVNLLLTEATLNEQAGDLERALALAKLAYYIDPGSAEVNAKLAELRLDLGYYQTAIVDLESYLFDVFPSSATNWAWLGTAYELTGRPNDAQVAFSRALQIDEGNARAYIGRGQYYLDQRRYQEALDDFNNAVDLAPNSLDALVGRAAAYTELEEYDEALADFDHVFELTTASGPVAALTDPEVNVDADFVLQYGETLLRTGSYAEVSRFTSELLVREITDEQRAQALELRAQAQLELGNLAGARSDIENALSIGETGYRHYLRGRVLEELNFTGQATREYEWVLLWDQVYGFEFAEDAQDRLEALTADDE
jgi:tetratricopeptide (TPR) repeat protein